MQEIECFIESDLEILSGHPPVERIGELCDELYSNYRILAVCAVLLDGDTDSFYHTLAKSGHVRAYFLARCQAMPEWRNPYGATGNGNAFFDVVAAHHFELAQEIVALSPKLWWEGEEYEDDFCFVFFFHLLVQNDSNKRHELRATLEQFEASLQGEESAKLKICHALFENDQDAFDGAFEVFLDEREAELAEEREKFFPDERIVYRTRSRIYIEALAILNIANSIGLKTESEYRYCPLLARLPMRVPFPTERVIALP
jgi:hypothetical protein